MVITNSYSNNSNAELFCYDKGEDNSTDNYVTMYMRIAIRIVKFTLSHCDDWPDFHRVESHQCSNSVDAGDWLRHEHIDC